MTRASLAILPGSFLSVKPLLACLFRHNLAVDIGEAEEVQLGLNGVEVTL